MENSGALIQPIFKFDFEECLVKQKDRNRELMIKYKYDCITEDELNQLHEQLSKLIYKIIISNHIFLDTNDIYQEVWLKIAKCRKGWNENKGTYVSTWVSLVCQSVCNTLRSGLLKRRSRFCLYDDLKTEDNTMPGEDIGVSHEMIDDKVYFLMEKKETWGKFVKKLNKKELLVLDAITQTSPSEIRAFDGASVCANRVTKKFLKNRLSLNDDELKDILVSIKDKFDVEVD